MEVESRYWEAVADPDKRTVPEAKRSLQERAALPRSKALATLGTREVDRRAVTATRSVVASPSWVLPVLLRFTKEEVPAPEIMALAAVMIPEECRLVTCVPWSTVEVPEPATVKDPEKAPLPAVRF